MAFSLAAVRAGIDNVVSAIIGGQTYPYWPDYPVTPCAVLAAGDGDYHLAFQKGLIAVPFDLWLAVDSTVTDEAQKSLDLYLSSGTGQTSSVVDALQNSTLGGACQTVHVNGWEGYGAIELPDGTRLFGAALKIVVYCDRK